MKELKSYEISDYLLITTALALIVGEKTGWGRWIKTVTVISALGLVAASAMRLADMFKRAKMARFY